MCPSWHSSTLHSAQPGGSGTKHPEPPARGAKVRKLPHPRPEAASLPSASFSAPAWGRGVGAPPHGVAAALAARRRLLLPPPPRALSRNRPKRSALTGARSWNPGRGRTGGGERRWTSKTTIAEPLPRPRPPPPHQAASPADMGWGSREGPGRGGVSARFSLLTFNLGTRCLGMRSEAARVLSAEGKQKRRGSTARTPGLRNPPPWAAAGFPSGCDQGGGKKRRRRKELGREAGGWGGAVDQVIRRIINLDGSLGRGRKLRRLPDA